MPRIVPVSDTHSYHRKVEVPDGDIFVHSGDITFRGEMAILEDFCKWMKELPHKHKLVVFGNHDNFTHYNKFAIAKKLIEDAGATLLHNSETTIDGLKFYGSPHTPTFYDWYWMIDRGKRMAENWRAIPDDVNVLITHGPPHRILDEAPRGLGQFDNVGCEDLLARIKELKKLRLHIFGHIHNSFGTAEKDGVIFVNAATCTEKYQPTNKPIVIYL